MTTITYQTIKSSCKPANRIRAAVANVETARDHSPADLPQHLGVLRELYQFRYRRVGASLDEAGRLLEALGGDSVRSDVCPVTFRHTLIA